MKHTPRMILAGAVALASLAVVPLASAGERVANPQTIFAKGMKWTERNGENKGVLMLKPSGNALINWNGTTYRGKWEKVDEYRVRTIWEAGGPPGSVWSIRETGNKDIPYVASRAEP